MELDEVSTAACMRRAAPAAAGLRGTLGVSVRGVQSEDPSSSGSVTRRERCCNRVYLTGVNPKSTVLNSLNSQQ